jgi:SAM-dependent methyltransferase
VGAGAGSYEPEDRHVLAVEPSPTMRAQRPPQLAPAIDAVAEALPFDDRSVDAAMAVSSVHQWPDAEKGLGELRRVARGPVVILTFDPEAIVRFWLADYVPEVVELESRRVPRIETVRRALGPRTEVRVVPVPADCLDGFTEAFYARPEKFLQDEVRASSRCGDSWTRRSKPASCDSCEPTSPPGRGTSATAPCAHFPPTRAPCGWSWATRESQAYSGQEGSPVVAPRMTLRGSSAHLRRVGEISMPS